MRVSEIQFSQQMQHKIHDVDSFHLQIWLFFLRQQIYSIRE